jgi:hypothetical protein
LSVRLLQYYNSLERTGAADIALQKLVYSGQAKLPDHPMLRKAPPARTSSSCSSGCTRWAS